MRTRRIARFVLLAAVGGVAVMAATRVGLGVAQHAHSPQEVVGSSTPAGPTRAADGARPPRRVTMEELHQAGGVPRGWKFAVPPGDPVKGRQLFVDFECYKCHLVKGEGFPATGPEPASTGPELTGMGSEHPAEYIAESILAPNHVIVEGRGHVGSDGLSTMPSFTDSLSLGMWLDLVAYLKRLTGDPPHAGHGIEREQVVGAYRVRLSYVGPSPGAGPHGAGASARPAPGRLSVFVTDREFDEPVPYLPVTAAVQAERRPTERLRLGPRMDEQGFHYGLDVTLPPRTRRITVSIGATTMQLAGSAKGKFAQAVTAVFDWEAAAR